MRYESGFKNLWRGLTRLSRGKKLLVVALLLVVVLTWLAACIVLVSLFV
jgi:hypothetical protein